MPAAAVSELCARHVMQGFSRSRLEVGARVERRTIGTSPVAPWSSSAGMSGRSPTLQSGATRRDAYHVLYGWRAFTQGCPTLESRATRRDAYHVLYGWRAFTQGCPTLESRATRRHSYHVLYGWRAFTQGCPTLESRATRRHSYHVLYGWRAFTQGCPTLESRATVGLRGPDATDRGRPLLAAPGPPPRGDLSRRG